MDFGNRKQEKIRIEGLEQNSKVEKVNMERIFFGRLVGSWKHPDWNSKEAFAQAIRYETGSSIWGEREREREERKFGTIVKDGIDKYY